MSMANKDKCFIITPIGDDTDPIRRHIEGIIDAALRPALEDKYDLVVAHRISEPGSITKQIITEKLSYSETCRRFEVNSRDRIKSWERIYLEEGPEGFAVERRGRGSKGRPPKQVPKQVEEDLLAEVQRLRAENDYLKNLQALVLEDERRQRRKRW